VVVGEWGTLLREGDDKFTEGESGTDAALAGIAAYQDDLLVAVGDQGVMLGIGWSSVRELESPTEQPLRAIIASEGWLTAVGAGGTVVRGPLEGLRTETLEGAPTLWGISGTADDALAVGDDGAVVRLTRLTTARLPCAAASGLRLRAVHKGERASFAVGVGGAIVRIEGDECFVEQAPVTERGALFAVGLDDEGRVFAAGEGGIAFVRANDGSWSELDLSVDVGVYGLLRTDRDVWLLGASGAILRHPRTDTGGQAPGGTAPAASAGRRPLLSGPGSSMSSRVQSLHTQRLAGRVRVRCRRVSARGWRRAPARAAGARAPCAGGARAVCQHRVLHSCSSCAGPSASTGSSSSRGCR
jgi:hypothetical protein